MKFLNLKKKSLGLSGCCLYCIQSIPDGSYLKISLGIFLLQVFLYKVKSHTNVHVITSLNSGEIVQYAAKFLTEFFKTKSHDHDYQTSTKPCVRGLSSTPRSASAETVFREPNPRWRERTRRLRFGLPLLGIPRRYNRFQRKKRLFRFQFAFIPVLGIQSDSQKTNPSPQPNHREYLRAARFELHPFL